MEGQTENNSVLHAIVKRLSSQILLFALAVILAVVGVSATVSEGSNTVIFVVLAIFVTALLGYLVFERGRHSSADVAPAEISPNAISSKTSESPFQVKVWTQPAVASASTVASRDISTVPDNDGVGYRVGDVIEIYFLANRDCYITLLNIGTSGALTVLFPNRIYPNNFVRANEMHVIPGQHYGFTYQLQGPPGIERLKVIATLSPEPVLETAADTTTSLFRSVSGAAAARDVGIVEEKTAALGPDVVAEAQWAFEVSSA